MSEPPCSSTIGSSTGWPSVPSVTVWPEVSVKVTVVPAWMVRDDGVNLVLAIETVNEEFHARFKAIRRSYLYRIANRPAPLALDRGKAWWHPVKLDHEAMHEAAQALIGKHDFTTFRAASCQAQSPVKTLDRLDITRDGDMIDCTVEARSFLHHQVRSMVGSLKLVGDGKWRSEDIKDALEARDRTRCGPVAPPTGLYLMRVDY